MDEPRPRIDLVRKAMESSCTGDFDWINDKVALRVGSDPWNCGFTAIEIRELAREWGKGGGEIRCGREERTNWKHRREFIYWVVVHGIDEFDPRGLYVEMELSDDDPNDPIVSLVNGHPASFPG